MKIHGEAVPVNARVATVSGFSAHADESEITRWLGSFPARPRQSFLVHGEPTSLAAAKARMDRLGWPAMVPKQLDQAEI